MASRTRLQCPKTEAPVAALHVADLAVAQLHAVISGKLLPADAAQFVRVDAVARQEAVDARRGRVARLA